MISATDSFIRYLTVGLNGSPKVNWVHITASDNDSDTLNMDTLNVSILAFSNRGPIEEALVSLDLIASDERQAWDWAKVVRDKLMEQQYTPELLFIPNPKTPTSLGRMVEWEGDTIRFRVIDARAMYIHLNATLPIRHSRF